MAMRRGLTAEKLTILGTLAVGGMPAMAIWVVDSQRGSTIFHLAQYSRCTRGESPNRKKKTKSYDSQRNTPAGVVTCSSTAFRWGNHICRVESPAATKSTCWDCFAIVLPYFLLLLISVNRCNLCKSRRKGKRNPFITCYYFSFTLYFYYFPISEWRSDTET